MPTLKVMPHLLRDTLKVIRSMIEKLCKNPAKNFFLFIWVKLFLQVLTCPKKDIFKTVATFSVTHAILSCFRNATYYKLQLFLEAV